jgi:uncharacterized membrane-anchored protein
MLVLGIILLLVVLGVSLGVLVGGGGQPSVDLGGLNVTTTTAGIFLTGAVAVVLLLLALWLIQRGTRRANRQRRDRKELHRLTRERGAGTTAGAAPASGTATGAAEASGAPASSATTEGPETAPAAGSSGATEDDTGPGRRSAGDGPVTDPDRPHP